MLDRVTITGADDSVDPGQLWELSAKFPFAEWGLLVGSGDRRGTSRFPRAEWWDALNREAVKRQHRDPLPQFSLHLCGAPLRRLLTEPSLDVLAGVPPSALTLCQRVQLNTHGRLQLDQVNVDGLTRFLTEYFPLTQVIQQVDGGCGHKLFERLYHAGVNAFPFFDLSHGAGVSPERWPTTPYADPLEGGACRRYCGFGGGLGPDNLREELPKVANAACGGRHWVDMETKVRSEDDRLFDLAKVVACLAACEPQTVWGLR